MSATTQIVVDRSKRSKRLITYDIFSGQEHATVRDKWHIDGQKFIHDWSCDCGQAGCRHIIQAKAKAFEKSKPALIEESIMLMQKTGAFKPFLED